jgi:hypothetical protein
MYFWGAASNFLIFRRGSQSLLARRLLAGRIGLATIK